MRAMKMTVVSLTLALVAALVPLGGIPSGAAQAGKEDKKSARVTLKAVRVKETNKEGDAWDVNNGKPDLVVRMKNLTDNAAKDFTSAEKQDTFAATFDAPALLVVEDQTIQIEVVDEDVADDDLIGRKKLVVSGELLRKGTADLSFDQVTSLTLEFRKP